MPNIKLLQPAKLDEAVALLASENEDAKIIAGGTALVIMLRNRLIAPATLISLGRLDELRTIRHEPGTGLRIGALATVREAELSPVVREKNPMLAHAFGKVGNVRVRNAATVGGALRSELCRIAEDKLSRPQSVLTRFALIWFRGILFGSQEFSLTPDNAANPRL